MRKFKVIIDGVERIIKADTISWSSGALHFSTHTTTIIVFGPGKWDSVEPIYDCDKKESNA